MKHYIQDRASDIDMSIICIIFGVCFVIGIAGFVFFNKSSHSERYIPYEQFETKIPR